MLNAVKLFLLVGLVTAASTSALAKGLMLHGTYQAPDPRSPGQFVTVDFVFVDATATRIARCNFDTACMSGPMETATCFNAFETPGAADETCSYLRDVVFVGITYRADQALHWSIDVAHVAESGAEKPLFVLEAATPDGADGVRLISESQNLDVLLQKQDAE